MAITTEYNQLYAHSHEHCFAVLKEKVLPGFRAKYHIGYANWKIQNGKIVSEDVSDRDDWKVCKAIIQFKYIPPLGIPFRIGSPVKILCRSTGNGYCSVDIVTDATNFYSSDFLNFILDIGYKKIPIYSWVVRNIIPNIYFDNIMVITGKQLKEKSFRNDIAKPGIDYLFRKLHEELKREIN